VLLANGERRNHAVGERSREFGDGRLGCGIYRSPSDDVIANLPLPSEIRPLSIPVLVCVQSFIEFPKCTRVDDADLFDGMHVYWLVATSHCIFVESPVGVTSRALQCRLMPCASTRCTCSAIT
jgi:hypothetical protein